MLFMRKLFVAGMAMTLFAACHEAGKQTAASASASGGFTITGTIAGVDSNKVYLTYREADSTYKDSATLKNGAFSFTGRVAGPVMFTLAAPFIPNPGSAPYLSFFAANDQVTIEASGDSLSKASVGGSATQQQYLAYRKYMQGYSDRSDSLMKLYRAAVKNGKPGKELEDRLDKAFDTLEKDKQSAIMAWVKGNPRSVVGAWAVTRSLLYEPDVKVLAPLYSSLDTSVKLSEYGKIIYKSLAIAEKLQPGLPAPDFSQTDTSGHPVSLSALKGKYVLVDFWASWCGPCRAENPNVVKAFNRYKDKGFTVLGVSLDDNRSNWLKAIQQDKLRWTQVSDLNGWKNAVAKQYGIQAIPSNFLLDRDGKILARNLRGDDLDKKLADIFK